MWRSQTPGLHPPCFNNVNPEWTSKNTPTRSVIPKSIPPDPGVVQNALPFIQSQYARWIKRMAFGDPPSSLVTALVGRLSISDTTFSVMTLGAKIIQSMLDTIDRTNWMAYEKPIDSLHWLACNMPEEGSSLVCTKGRLIAAIEPTTYKFFVSNSASGYSFLRRVVPLLIRVAEHYPQIWMGQGKISTQRILNLDVMVLSSFLWMDTMSSTFLGAAPLIRYNTSVQGKSGLSHPIEWLNGCPREFICWFAMFNEIRSTTTRYEGGSLLIDWEVVEKEIQEWESVIDRTNLSRNNITRLAAPEGRRHALLIYLYVGICGVNSVDPRVQSAVNQIIQLSQVVQHEAAYERHFFGPAIFAGACAHLESQRKSILRIVAFQRCTRMWVLQISDFVFVLYHLWRGAARGGHPITWEDYVHSRRAVLPVNEQDLCIA